MIGDFPPLNRYKNTYICNDILYVVECKKRKKIWFHPGRQFYNTITLFYLTRNIEYHKVAINVKSNIHVYNFLKIISCTAHLEFTWKLE